MTNPLESLSSQLGLSAEQKALIATEYLSELKAGLLPFPIFSQVARLMTTATVEIGFMKPPVNGENDPSILLTQRASDDPWWPNEWHVPGSVIRANDEIKHEHDYAPAVKRVLGEVGGSVVLTKEPIFFDTVHRGDHRDNVEKQGDALRGSEITLHGIAEVQGEPERGVFFNVADVILHPPEGGLIVGHEAVIQKVSDYYQRIRSLQS